MVAFFPSSQTAPQIIQPALGALNYLYNKGRIFYNKNRVFLYLYLILTTQPFIDVFSGGLRGQRLRDGMSPSLYDYCS